MASPPAMDGMEREHQAALFDLRELLRLHAVGRDAAKVRLGVLKPLVAALLIGVFAMIASTLVVKVVLGTPANKPSAVPGLVGLASLLICSVAMFRLMRRRRADETARGV